MDRIKQLFESKEPVTDFAEVRKGRMRLKGKVKAGPESVRSPIKSIPCVAFFYRAWYNVRGRTGAVERILGAAEVYAPVFYIEMKGGALRVTPKKTGSFSAAEHREIVGRRVSGLQTTEQIIKHGSTIGIDGKVVRTADGLCLIPSKIQLIEEDKRKKRGKKKQRPKRRRR